MNWLTRDVLIHLREFCRYSDFANLLATCKKYSRYKYLLHCENFQEPDYKSIYNYLKTIAVKDVFSRVAYIGRRNYKVVKDYRHCPIYAKKIFSLLFRAHKTTPNSSLVISCRYLVSYHGNFYPSDTIFHVNIDRIRILRHHNTLILFLVIAMLWFVNKLKIWNTIHFGERLV